MKKFYKKMLTDIFLYVIIKTVQKNSTFTTVSKPLTICARQKGIIMLRVTNMLSPRTGKPVANQFIIEGDGKTTFQSYASMIVEIDWLHNLIKIGKDWDYGATTGKYRNSFFYEKGFRQIANIKDMRKLMKSVDSNGCAYIILEYSGEEFKVVRA